jgi:uncharacterized membrane protein YphA (DoxX/SURF4 family)
MKKILLNEYFVLALRLLIGGLFVYASLDKLFNQQEFARAIYNYKFLPDQLINIFAIVLPYVEFTAGGLLILGFLKRGSTVLIIVMLVMFIIALTAAYAKGLDISCGCFSLETVSQKGDILKRIIEDIFLLAGSIIVFIKYNSQSEGGSSK